MGDAQARVYRIDPGTLVVIEGMAPSAGMAEALTEELAARVGHHQFLVLVLPPPGVATVMPAGELLEWLAAQGVHLEASPQGPVLADHRPQV